MASEEKSLGQKLWGLFVEEVPPSKKPEPSVVPPTVVAATAPSTPPQAQTANDNSKFTAHFTQLVEKQQAQSTDYIRFIQTVHNLSNMGLSEAQAYAAAWTSFKTLHTTSDAQQLWQQAQLYQKLFEQDKEAFLKDADHNLQVKTEALQQSCQQKQAENQKIKAEIAALEQKIIENTRAIEEASVQIQVHQDKIIQTKQQYLEAYNTFLHDITQNGHKIQQYLLSNTSL